MNMKTPRPKRKPFAKAEFVRQLQQDPDYLALLEELKERRRPAIEERRRVEAPIVEELRNTGYLVESPNRLVDLFQETGAPYTEAVPILVKWLPQISNAEVKESIVRTLSVPWAKEAARALIREFRSLPNTAEWSSCKWAIGNALSVVADDSVLSEVVDLVRDKGHGKSREMVALALANMRNERAVDVLIELLEDEEVAGHAVMALRKLKLKARKAEPHLERFLSHPKPWVRKEAEKALRRIWSAK